MAEVTFTVTVHELLAGTVAPARTRLVPLFAAVTVAPAHVDAPEAEAVFTRFAGYVSVKPVPVTTVAFGFVSVTVSTLALPVPIVAGVKVCATVSPASTESDELAATVLDPAFDVVSAPTPIVFV